MVRADVKNLKRKYYKHVQLIINFHKINNKFNDNLGYKQYILEEQHLRMN